jgi:hypothetical protein
MRYVHRKLVIRMAVPPAGALLEGINSRFADILLRGRFTVELPQPEERDEPELAHLSRLVFHFNRRSLGRLRQLVDALNRGSVD